MSGKLTVICGPMYSGKTGELTHFLEQYEYRDEKAIGLQPAINSRDDIIESRDGRSFDAFKVKSLGEISVRDIVKYQAIGVDELFMFDKEDAIHIYNWLKLDRNVYVSTLDVLANGRIPEIYSRILTLGPEIIKRTAVCHFCKEPATHSTAMIDDIRVFPDSDISVQGSQNSPEYFASCLDHFDPDTDRFNQLLS